jgi:glycosyltransferase involved in cell wall biosynthesis
MTEIANLPNKLKRFLTPIIFRREYKKIRPDLVIFNHVTFCKFTRFIKETRYFVVVHGIEVWRKLTYSETNFLENAFCIISNSEFTGRRLEEKGISREKIKVLHFGVDTEKFRIIPEEPNKLKIQHSSHILLTVSRLEACERYKGYDRIIELLPELSKELPDIRYVIIGDGTDRMRIMNLAKESNVADKLILPGRVGDYEVINYYNLCDVFVMPSEFYIEENRVAGEGLGIVYLEAAACGRPVIGGKGGGCSEAIEDGVTGFLVDPNDKKGLYETIVKLLRDKELAKKMGAAGRKRVEENFSYEVFLKKVKEIFL